MKKPTRVDNTIAIVFENIRGRVLQYQLASAVVLVVIITSVMTTISMVLYVRSGASGLDLSRPGFSKTRNTIKQTVEPDFSSTGPLSAADLETFKSLYAKQRQDLQALGSFDDTALSDEALGFILSDEPLPGNQ